MTWKAVTLAAGTCGSAEGGTSLNAFDNALLAAGIGNVNLIKLSSIMPPAIRIIPLPRIKPGTLVPAAYAAMSSAVPGEMIAAAIGWGVPEEDHEAGVIMEAHGSFGADDAARMVERMLDEAFEARGIKMRAREIHATDHRVQREGCAIAAVALLSPGDLLDPGE